MVVTATDDLGASATYEVPVKVTASSPTKYKFGVSATYLKEPISFGEDGLNAEISYYAGSNGDFRLENLDNEYFDKTNKYVIQIEKWSVLRDTRMFSGLEIAGTTVTSAQFPTGGSAKNFRINGKANALSITYTKSVD